MTYAISKKGIALLQKCEGFRAKPAMLPNGDWVVGFGHVRMGTPGNSVTRDEATMLLLSDLAPFERLINATVQRPLTQSQFDALVSVAFSLGEAGFRESVFLEQVNAGGFADAACALDVCGDGDDLAFEALMRRRTLEKALFLRDVRYVAAPSALLRLALDIAPRQDIGRRLSEILLSEPKTASALRAKVAALAPVPEEIVTAHARPAARPVGPGSTRLDWRGWLSGRISLKRRAEHVGLVALLAFGGVLTFLGGSMFFTGSAAMVDSVVAATVSAPGLFALSLAGYGLWRGPEG